MSIGTLALLTAVVLPPGLVQAALRDTAGAAAQPPAAPAATLLLEVLDFDSGLPIDNATYEWRIDADDTGDPRDTAANRDACFPATNPDYPAGCPWPSVHTFTGGAGGADNFITQGDGSELNEATGLDVTKFPVDPDHPTDPTYNKFLISIVADGHKIGGVHFSLPIDEPGLVTAMLHPDPLPFATINVQIFDDTSTNGQFDPQVEGPPVPSGSKHFEAHIADVLGEVTTDWYGNPICGTYGDPADPDTFDPGSGGHCIDADNDGIITIPNLGSNRYSVSVVPPDGETWIQTSTLEGAHDWDVWAYEGFQGNDPEVIQNGAPIATAQFGFVRPTSLTGYADVPSTGDPAFTGSISGEVWSTKSYLPPAGGDTDEAPVAKAWVALTDLQGTGDDVLVFAGPANADGTFTINGVAPSTYAVAMWDEPQNLLLGITTIIVGDNAESIGRFFLPHWFSYLEGTVFVDDDGDGTEEATDGNGVQDAGEPGLAGYAVALKSRDNAIVDAGSKVSTTDSNGRYTFDQVYPYGYWTILEAYSDLFYTTGVNYRSDNMFEADGVTPRYNVRLGAGVDVSVLNQDGISSEINWGVRPYARGTNGGIVGSVTLGVTRNELDARLAATEDYEPGIPGLTVNLWQPVTCVVGVSTTCDPSNTYETDPDGGYTKGKLLNDYLTEEFLRPTGCQALNAAGDPLTYQGSPLAFMSPVDDEHECIESPLMGNQIKTGPTESAPWDQSDDPTGDSEFSLVNGNYGFGDGCLNSTFVPGDIPGTGHCEDGNGAEVDAEALVPADYLVEVTVPDDAWGKPKYQVLREEDVNVFDGDDFTPAVPPPACAGALHTVDVAGVLPDGPDAVDNPAFAEGGGSPYEGQDRPLCDVKLVPVQNSKSVAPSFFFFDRVPAPGRLFGAVVEDLALGTDPTEFYYGEKAGIPNSPIGVYDYTGTQVTRLQSDPNGFFEVLLPSTRTFNCPLPAGPCPNVYKVVGNDPGVPGAPNANYDPQYATLESDWQMWPGLTLLADVALLPTAAVIEVPGSQNTHPPDCTVEPGRPQLFAVSKPYATDGGSVTITGQHFGVAEGSVTLDGAAVDPADVTWSDTSISATLTGFATGPHQLAIVADTGLPTVNGLTFHVLGAGYEPTIYEVDPTGDHTSGGAYDSVQAAIDAAATDYLADDATRALVVVYPNAPDTFTPLGDYYENVIIHTPLKLQGIGPGGVRDDESFELGSILNGLGFATQRADAWADRIEDLRSGIGWDGSDAVADGQIVYVLARDGEFDSAYPAAIDGFSIKGGTELGAEGTFVVPNYPTQGGGIFVNAYARHLRITNDVIAGNSGAYGGAIRVGTPNVGSQHNDDLLIATNRIVANGGANLAGAIGLFNGTDGYEISGNDICGNFSAEYGGGISHYGLSSATGPAASIHDNRIWLNRSYDEGGGIIVAGEQQPAADPVLSPGSGPVEISANYLQGNLADDDGGGLRFLMAGDWPIDVVDNVVVNNVSTHEGGGIALDDAPDVRLVNNTIARNLTTATGQDSNGDPAPAGLSTIGNSALLQASLPTGSDTFSNPLMFNNVFWDNRAGDQVGTSGTGFSIEGLGLGGPSDINVWDMGVVDGGALEPTNSVLTGDPNSVIVADASNVVGVDPNFKAEYELTIDFLPWRAGGFFTFVYVVSDDLPPGSTEDVLVEASLGNYHIDFTAGAPAGAPTRNAGAGSKGSIGAPSVDIDGQGRPSNGGFEIGADEEPGATGDITGPLLTGEALVPNPASTTSTLTANADDSTTGMGTIAAAEYWIDAGSAVAMDAVDGTFDEIAEDLTATIDTSGLGEGAHDVHLRAQDSSGNWSATSTLSLGIDQEGPAFTAGPTASPNPADGSPTVSLTATVDDTAHGGSTIASATWWRDCNTTPQAMSADDGLYDEVEEMLTATVTVLGSGCGIGSQTIYVNAVDAAGHDRTASVILNVPDLIFADGFETGDTSRWAQIVTPANQAVLAGAAHDGSYGLRVTLDGGTKVSVADTTPTAEAQYRARFWFNPNGSNTGTKEESILVAKSASGKTVFSVQVRNSGASYQFRGVGLIANKDTKLDWTAGLANGWHWIEVAWQTGPSGGLSVIVDGVAAGTLTGNTSAWTVDTVFLGALGGQNGPASGTQYFDSFVSTRTTPIGP